jgi:hypothetical protein
MTLTSWVTGEKILPEMLAIVPRRLRNHLALQSRHIFVVLVVVLNGVGCCHSIEAKMLVSPWFYAIAPLEKATLWQILLNYVTYKLGFLGYSLKQHVQSKDSLGYKKMWVDYLVVSLKVILIYSTEAV